MCVYDVHITLIIFASVVFNQDAQIKELKEQVASMSSQNEQMQTTITQQMSQIQQHKDQYNILKLKLGGFVSYSKNRSGILHRNECILEET